MLHSATLARSITSASTTANPNVDALRAQMRALGTGTHQSKQKGSKQHKLTFGCEAIDARLGEQGLKAGAVHEFAGALPDIGSLTGLALLLGMRAPQKPIIWITPQITTQESGLLYAPAYKINAIRQNTTPLMSPPLMPSPLMPSPLMPSPLMLVRVRDSRSALWAAEEALSDACQPLVVLDMAALKVTEMPKLAESRRLSLTAQQSGATCLLLARYPDQHALNRSSLSAETRWRLQTKAAPIANRHKVDTGYAELSLLRQRTSPEGVAHYGLPAPWFIHWSLQSSHQQQETEQEDTHYAPPSVHLVSRLRARKSAAPSTSFISTPDKASPRARSA